MRLSSSPYPEVSQSHYRPDIDGLRALAVLLVIGFHAFPSVIAGGFIGVDVFFVISGYLISRILFNEIQSGTFHFWHFYSRRIRRIFPALLTVLIFALGLGWFVLMPSEYVQLGLHTEAGAGFIANFIFWKESGYFDNAALTKPLLQLWSLGIEEQFYVLWPIALYCIYKLKRSWLIPLVVLTLGSFVANLIATYFNPVAAFYSPFTRFWELSLGALLAYMQLHHPHKMQELPHTALSILGLVLIILGALVIWPTFAFPGAWALLPSCGAALFLASPKGVVNQHLLCRPIFVGIGLISYPLYLWHWPLLSFAHILDDGLPSWPVRIGLILFACLLATLTYRFIEKPLRFGGASTQKSIALLLAMLAVGSMGYVITINNGFAARVSAYINTANYFNWTNRNWDAACNTRFAANEEQYCLIDKPSAPITAALLGDSHANSFYWGLRDYYASQGGNLANFGVGDCPPFFDIDRGQHPAHGNAPMRCYAKTKAMFDFVLNDASIKDVFLLFQHGDMFRPDVKFIDKREQIQGGDNYLNTQAALIRTISELQARNKNIILIQDWPSLPFDISQCFKMRPLGKYKTDCDFHRLFMNDMDSYNVMLKEVQGKTGVKIFYTAPFIAGNFPVNAAGIPTYRDQFHLTITGSQFFTDKVAEIIKQ